VKKYYFKGLQKLSLLTIKCLRLSGNEFQAVTPIPSTLLISQRSDTQYLYQLFIIHLQLSVCVSVVERELLELLPFSEQCSPDEAELVCFCYKNILNKVELSIKHRTQAVSVLNCL